MKIIANCKVNGNQAVLTSKNLIKVEDGEYVIDFKEVGKHRSLSQNAMLWGIIGEICKEIDGTLIDEETVYIQLLEMTGAKYTDVEIPKLAYDQLKSMVKYTKILSEYNGKIAVRIFGGSSTFNTKEMSELIDMALRYAEKSGIVTDYWKDLLKRER